MEILSIVGAHANESLEEIFSRKMQDVKKYGMTFWLYKSWGCKPAQCENAKKVIFLESSSKGRGARPTTVAENAREYSLDNKTWDKIPYNLQVTGQLPAYAFILKDLQIVDETYDIGSAKFMLGKSTVIKDDSAKSGVCRKVMAIGAIKNVVYVR
ncbi:MAG: hypothetical protein HYV97_03765 [Bdellovibrio sp.]|nr:hypothetical protein [Bdellovibrio sp.]